VYPIFPSKLNKHELAFILLNNLTKKRQLLDNFGVEVEKDDSGWVVLFFMLYFQTLWQSIFKYFYYIFSVFMEEELMSVDECLIYYDAKLTDTLSSQPTLATVLELFGYTY
jgi:hypothetical protein